MISGKTAPFIIRFVFNKIIMMENNMYNGRRIFMQLNYDS